MTKIISANQITSTKHYTSLSMLYITIMLVMVVTCSYMVDLKGFIFNEGAALIPFLYVIENIIAEVYGYKFSRKLIWRALICEAIFVLSVILLVHLPSPHYWIEHQSEYRRIYDSFFKILLVNMLFFPMGEFANVIVLSKLKVLLKGKAFWLRSVFSNLFGILILAIFGNIIFFAGTVTIGRLLEIMLASFILKIVFSIILTTPSAILANLLKQNEGIDIYDLSVNYNPFKTE